ncbi:MAG: ArsR family transcriptional regulator, partial [Nanoarchaeota archaeon]
MVHRRDNLELEIINVLLRAENHIRGIAKRLGESHSTVLRKLNNLQKENVVDSKVEGKNKIFFLKNNIIAKNYIKKAEL